MKAISKQDMDKRGGTGAAQTARETGRSLAARGRYVTITFQ
jgi:hypothetical protein